MANQRCLECASVGALAQGSLEGAYWSGEMWARPFLAIQRQEALCVTEGGRVSGQTLQSLQHYT